MAGYQPDSDDGYCLARWELQVCEVRHIAG